MSTVTDVNWEQYINKYEKGANIYIFAAVVTKLLHLFMKLTGYTVKPVFFTTQFVNFVVKINKN